MAINLDGIVSHHVELVVVGNDSIFITTTIKRLLLEALELPFSTSLISNIKIAIWTGGTDAIAVAERIAISWENDGFKVNRVVCKAGVDTVVQSFVLA